MSDVILEYRGIRAEDLERRVDPGVAEYIHDVDAVLTVHGDGGPLFVEEFPVLELAAWLWVWLAKPSGRKPIYYHSETGLFCDCVEKCPLNGAVFAVVPYGDGWRVGSCWSPGKWTREFDQAELSQQFAVFCAQVRSDCRDILKIDVEPLFVPREFSSLV